MLLADRKEMWWVAVMGVGLDPELSNTGGRGGITQGVS